MSLPEWCQTHSLKDFMELVDLGHSRPNKEKKMNDTVNDVVAELPVVEATEVQHFIVQIDPETGAETRIPVSVAGAVQEVPAEQPVA